jgi:hypothetical protein
MAVDLFTDLSMPAPPKGMSWEVWVDKDGLALWLCRRGDSKEVTTLRLEEAREMGFKRAVISMGHDLLATHRSDPELRAQLAPIAAEIAQLNGVKVKVKI